MIIVCINKLLIDGAVAAVKKNCCVQHGLHEKCSCVVWLMLGCDSAFLDAQATMIFSRLCAQCGYSASRAAGCKFSTYSSGSSLVKLCDSASFIMPL
jgi:hypothetical protein